MRADIKLERDNGISLDRQIADGIIKAIDDGLLRPGDHLMPIRQIANTLGVARATVDAAYALKAIFRLRAEKARLYQPTFLRLRLKQILLKTPKASLSLKNPLFCDRL